MATVSARKLIRQYVINLLKVGLPEFNNRVFGNRDKPLHQTEMPCVLVYTKSEQAAIYIEAPRSYQITLKLEIQITSRLRDGADDYLDDICEKIEELIFNDTYLNGLAQDVLLSDTESDFKYEGEQGVAGSRITFDVLYEKVAPEETLGLDPLIRAHVEYKSPPDTGQAPIVNDIVLPQV